MVRLGFKVRLCLSSALKGRGGRGGYMLYVSLCMGDRLVYGLERWILLSRFWMEKGKNSSGVRVVL